MTEYNLLDRFRAMVQMRHFEEACQQGVPTREIHGELHTGLGQEAIAAGMIGALWDEDALVSTHRNHYHAIAKGVPLLPLMAEIFEKDSGLCRGRGGHMHPFDPQRNFHASGIVGASMPVALGYAYAFWITESRRVAVAVIGDGGANTGAFHESLNIAGTWKLPFVIVVENNRYAISVPFRAVSATQTIAERARVYGAWGKVVDGTDVEAVALLFGEAVEHARAGKGPALLEASCARFAGHYEGDLDLYRPKADKDREKREQDPIRIARRKLVERGESTEANLDAVIVASFEATAKLLGQVREAPLPDATGALDFVFVNESQP